MEDLLLMLLYGVAELFGEVLVEVAGEVITTSIFRFFRNAFDESRTFGPMLAVAGFFVLGVVFGGLSLLMVPHSLVHPSKIHGISLIVSPVITGLLMACAGYVRRRYYHDALRIESFGFGFTFALGMAIIRFFFVR
jgi:hypothetical protein